MIKTPLTEEPIKEPVAEFVILQQPNGLLMTEIRDERKAWEIYGFLKIYLKDLEKTLESELKPRDDEDKHLF